ncbi:DUF3108 domain-containing protein [Aliikangiella sp. G2MR2-5]|uniref:DUF3108 domain-containing protein n=1 Tax=Aliikangiella sp. G2MR2-5 TaxID=2788943 RepID=UPI0018A9E8CC|nr:DUF3108 domain-containing protein [Aliikangiella sp. G2MR2-5]
MTERKWIIPYYLTSMIAPFRRVLLLLLLAILFSSQSIASEKNKDTESDLAPVLEKTTVSREKILEPRITEEEAQESATLTGKNLQDLDNSLSTPPINESALDENVEIPSATLSVDLSAGTASDCDSGITADAQPDAQPDTQWRFLRQYRAVYSVNSDGKELGKATRTLTEVNNIWKLQIQSKLSKWMLTLRSNEFTEFVPANSLIKTRKFYTSSKVTFKSPRVIEQSFDWQARKETGKRDKQQWELSFECKIYDRMSHLIQLRADLLNGTENLLYNVSYKGRHKLYQYQISGQETLKSNLGNLETIRIDRIKGDESRFSLWLSPELNYLPVQIAQVEQDKPDVTMSLVEFEYIN